MSLALLSLLLPPALALDNPESPDRLSAFAARSASYEAAVNEVAGNTAEVVRAYGRYERFLDQELNLAYQDLQSRLAEPERQKLVHAQRRWLQYREAELAFVDAGWTPERYGSSFRLTRGEVRVALLRQRVIELLKYMASF